MEALKIVLIIIYLVGVIMSGFRIRKTIKSKVDSVPVEIYIQVEVTLIILAFAVIFNLI